MAALATTTLSVEVLPSDALIQVASTSGMTPGVRLFHGQELMAVIRLGIRTQVYVQRGVDGTRTTAHPSSATLHIGRADEFYDSDPIGPPSGGVPVTPWINVRTGDQWTPQGDDTGLNRWWAKTDFTHGVGALGVRQTTAAATTVTNS